MKEYTIKVNELEAIALAASEEDWRDSLQGVYIENDLMVATDGHMLAGLRLNNAATEEGFILRSEDIEKALSLAEFATNKALIKINRNKLQLEIEVFEDETIIGGFNSCAINSNYPDFRKYDFSIQPKHSFIPEIPVKISLNANFLVKFRDIIQILVPSTTPAINIELIGHNDPIIIKTHNLPDFCGLIMPYKL